MQDILPVVLCGVTFGVGVIVQSIWLAQDMKAHMARFFLRRLTGFIDAVASRANIEVPTELRDAVLEEAHETAELYSDHSGFYMLKTVVLWVVVAVICAAIYTGYKVG